MSLQEIALKLKDDTNENIILVYAFNGTGKTQLCVAYKNISKNTETGEHTGVYYNAFSEDLFTWDNDEENDNANIKLNIGYSSLNQFHGLLTPEIVSEKLAPYFPKYRFDFNKYENEELGIESVSFFIGDEEESIPIKISRGEERIFVWCFFLGLFEVDGLANQQDAHYFIDDPVSSLDDYNIFVTAETIFQLVEANYLKKRIIITTHHIGLFSILADRLMRGEKSGRYKNSTKPFILGYKADEVTLSTLKGDVFLFHLHLLRTLEDAIKSGLFAYHFVLLRQLLENISSFLGTGRVNRTLSQIGIDNVENVANTINSLSHKNIYQMKSSGMVPAEEEIFKDVFGKLQAKYGFVF